MKLVRIRPIARQELDDAIGWYEKQKAGLGSDFEEAVHSLFQSIAATPERFRPVKGDIRRALMKKFPYAIHFVVDRNAVIVLAVFHTRRDPRHLEKRF